MRREAINPTSRELSMKTPPKAQIDAVQSYLEREFPHCVHRTWWLESVTAQVFEFSNDEVYRRIVIEDAFFQRCPDCAEELRYSDLADYVRESRAPRRCFHIVWNENALHIRSKPL
jgi:hypothetical protein